MGGGGGGGRGVQAHPELPLDPPLEIHFITFFAVIFVGRG